MEEYLKHELGEVLHAMENVPPDFEPELETPANPEHGDLASNAALQLPRHLKQPPRQIAEEIVRRLRDKPLDRRRVAGVEIAGPGFINFRFADTFLTDRLTEILEAGADYGKTTSGEGQMALVEYVSANPTGPLNVGHGRNAVLGDTIANLLEWTGYDVTREYYFNDAGRQMRVLAASVRAHYERLVNPDMPTKQVHLDEDTTAEVPASFPEEGYLGEYIVDIARDLYEQQESAPEKLVASDDLTPFKEAAEEAIFADIEVTLDRLGVHMDAFFNEYTLYEDEKIEETLAALRGAGYVYEQDGATWFKTTAFGKDQDTVLVKSSGEPTYRLPDIAYHATKYERDYDRIVDVFGADHIATYPDVLNALEVLGYPKDRVDVIIYQFVTLVRSGNPVKMSTRRANYVTLDDLIEDVGADVTRFFFLMRSPNTHLDFDLDLAKEASDKNPVFYLQYAHARICSIIRKAEEVGFSFGDAPDLTLLDHEAEQALVKELIRLPETIEQTVNVMEPQRLVNYLNDVAVAFTDFYGSCRIIGEDKALATARMHLARATRTVLRNGLTVLGISAPDRM